MLCTSMTDLIGTGALMVIYAPSMTCHMTVGDSSRIQIRMDMHLFVGCMAACTHSEHEMAA